MAEFFVTFDQVLGRLVASLRFTLGESQASFAQLCGLRQRTLSTIETGASSIPAIYLLQLDRGLARTLSYFEPGDLIDSVEFALAHAQRRGWKVFRRPPARGRWVPVPPPQLNALVQQVALRSGVEARRSTEEWEDILGFYDES